MKLVFLIGSGAVGKMTVGQELMKLTGLRLFHNHMTIEPVLEIFGTFHGPAISAMREVVFQEFAKSDSYGMIFTYMWAFDMQSDWDYEGNLQAIRHGVLLCGAGSGSGRASGTKQNRKPFAQQAQQARCGSIRSARHA